MKTRALVCAFVVLFCNVSLWVQASSNEIRLLIITGIDYPGHHWRETTPVLLDSLQRDSRLKVDVLSDPYRLDRFDLSPYDALIMHFMNWEKPDPNEAARENLRRYVADGGGLVLIHFACVTRALSSFEADDELYTCLTGAKPIELLATARSKITHSDHPMAFVHTYEKGKVFLTPLGHDVRALRTPGTMELIHRACIWVSAARCRNHD